MKWLLIPALFAALSLQAQTTANKLPKMTMIEGAFSTKFNIGNQIVSKRDAFAHLLKNKNTTGDAYATFRKANQQNTAAWLWLGTMCIGGALAVYGVATNGLTSNSALLGYGFTAIGATGSLITAFSSSKNYQKSVNTYNKFAGY